MSVELKKLPNRGDIYYLFKDDKIIDIAIEQDAEGMTRLKKTYNLLITPKMRKHRKCTYRKCT